MKTFLWAGINVAANKSEARVFATQSFGHDLHVPLTQLPLFL